MADNVNDNVNDNVDRSAATREETFVWHPDYMGKPVAVVRSSLATEIASDQRAYALTLEGAEEHEGNSLTSIIALERKWGPFDLNWAETDPGQLADRIIAFELDRDRRQELIPYATYRDLVSPREQPGFTDPAASQRLESPLARRIIVLVVILILIGAWFLLFR